MEKPSWIKRPVEAHGCGRGSAVNVSVRADGRGWRVESGPVYQIGGGLQCEGKIRRVADDEGDGAVRGMLDGGEAWACHDRGNRNGIGLQSNRRLRQQSAIDRCASLQGDRRFSQYGSLKLGGSSKGHTGAARDLPKDIAAPPLRRTLLAPAMVRFPAI